MLHRLEKLAGQAAFALTSLLMAALVHAQQNHPAVPPDSPPADWGPVSINLDNVTYPYPVQFLSRNIMGQDVRIAFMDVAPTARANGRTVVLLHGSSYYGWYWRDTIAALAAEGYRVVTVHRLGWGRSSKPILPYTHELHSANTKAMLDGLGIEQAAIVGHSLGGRMASYFAFTYPDVSRAAVDLLPNGELHMIPNVGHNPHLEAPEIFNRELLRFLSTDT